MKVLFVSSGNINYNNGIGPIIKHQGESLRSLGMEIEYFTINGRGIFGYLKNIFILKKYLSKNSYDLIHAHYSFSGIIASFSSRLPVVVSLMGYDVAEAGFFWRTIISLFNRVCWKATIVKSQRMAKIISLKNVHIIPNGINLSLFKPKNRDIAKENAGFNNKKHILFVSDPSRPEKNFQLAEKCTDFLNKEEVELNVVSEKSMEKIPDYLNAADVLLLTSLHEGSPNIIKEAMACNCPIVSTDVGDVKDVISGTEGCYLTSFDPQDVADKIENALVFNKRTNGRENIKHLEAGIIADKIINIYKELI